MGYDIANASGNAREGGNHFFNIEIIFLIVGSFLNNSFQPKGKTET